MFRIKTFTNQPFATQDNLIQNREFIYSKQFIKQHWGSFENGYFKCCFDKNLKKYKQFLTTVKKFWTDTISTIVLLRTSINLPFLTNLEQ